jgi:hypothetical protein
LKVRFLPALTIFFNHLQMTKSGGNHLTIVIAIRTTLLWACATSSATTSAYSVHCGSDIRVTCLADLRCESLKQPSCTAQLCYRRPIVGCRSEAAPPRQNK